jgi:hypothetical protein
MGNTKSKRDTDNDYMHRLDTNLVTVLTLFNMDPKSGYLQSDINSGCKIYTLHVNTKLGRVRIDINNSHIVFLYIDIDKLDDELFVRIWPYSTLIKKGPPVYIGLELNNLQDMIAQINS